MRFQPGLTAIVGPNGAGKTTLLEAIGYGLFGFMPHRPQVRFMRHGTTEARVQVEFTSPRDGRVYRVERTMRRPRSRASGALSDNAATTVSLFDVELNRAIDQPAAELEAWLAGQLGVEGLSSPADVFEHVVGVPQGRLTADFLDSPRLRKARFDPILRTAEYQQAADLLRRLTQHYAQARHALQVRASHLEGRLAAEPELLARLAAARQALEQTSARRSGGRRPHWKPQPRTWPRRTPTVRPSKLPSASTPPPWSGAIRRRTEPAVPPRPKQNPAPQQENWKFPAPRTRPTRPRRPAWPNSSPWSNARATWTWNAPGRPQRWNARRTISRRYAARPAGPRNRRPPSNSTAISMHSLPPGANRFPPGYRRSAGTQNGRQRLAAPGPRGHPGPARQVDARTRVGRPGLRRRPPQAEAAGNAGDRGRGTGGPAHAAARPARRARARSRPAGSRPPRPTPAHRHPHLPLLHRFLPQSGDHPRRGRRLSAPGGRARAAAGSAQYGHCAGRARRV